MNKYKLGRLIESFSFAFGRIVYSEGDIFTVKFGQKEFTYKKGSEPTSYKFYDDTETNYLKD